MRLLSLAFLALVLREQSNCNVIIKGAFFNKLLIIALMRYKIPFVELKLSLARFIVFDYLVHFFYEVKNNIEWIFTAISENIRFVLS